MNTGSPLKEGCWTVLAVAFVCAASVAQAREIHVRAGVGNAGRGSRWFPYRTIQAAASRAVPGDVVTIHAGVYRETVRPRRSGTAARPITFRAAPGERVIVSGADRLSLTWHVYQGNIYVASTGAAVEELFVGGQEMVKARWPNAVADDLVHMPRAEADAGTGTTTLVDAALPPGNWTGAEVAIVPGARWVSYTRKVAAYDEPTRTITFDAPIDELAALAPAAGSPYYLRGALGLLDAPGEWFLDAASGQLYLWAPGGGDPTYSRVGVKVRELAFDLADRAFVNVVGLRVFAAGMGLDNARHCVLRGVHVRYPVADGATNGYLTARGPVRTTGVGNRWVHGSISFSPESGLVIGGAQQVVEGMLVHDVAYNVPGGGAGIETFDPGTGVAEPILRRNTLRRSGRIGINHFHTTGGRITNNLIEDVGLLSNDIGFIYGWGTDGSGTEIAYNIGRHNRARFGNGIYLDDGTTGHVVHHNLIQDVWGHGVFFKEPNRVYNNTVVGSGLQMIGRAPSLPPYDAPVDLTTAEIFNNVGPENLVQVGVMTPSGESAGVAVEATADWRTVTVPWSALVRPFWESSDPLDLTQVDRLLLRETSTGAFDVFVDNVALTGGAGGSTLLLDDFDDGDLQNALGSYWWADGGANCASCSPSTASLTNEAAAGHGSVAHFTVHQEPDGWNNAGTGIPGIDASSYVAVRLDLRATGVVEIRGELADAPYLNNASCPLDANFVVSDACGIDQGRLVPPYTDGFAGAAPDLGAFESGRPRWTAGSTVDDVPVWSACESRLP